MERSGNGSIIEAENLTKIYVEGRTEVKAVDGISLSVKPRELVAVVGPSGSGKTTLLSMLGCILKPTSGSLLIDKKEITLQNEKSLPFIRRKYIGFIFQSFNLFAHLTALENVMVSLNMKGVLGKDAREQAQRLLEEVGLGDRLHFHPRELSGGQKQRVSIARALAAKPPVILADEPTGNLDSKTGVQITQMLREMAKKEGCAVVVVTHDSRISYLLDRILYLEDGRIKDGT